MPAGSKSGKRVRSEDEGEGALTSGDAEEAPPASTKLVRVHEPEAAPAAGPSSAPAVEAKAEDGDAEMGEGAHEHEHGDGGEAHDGGEGHAEEGVGAGPGPSGAHPRPHYTDKQTVFIKGLRPAVKDEQVDEFLKKSVPDGIKDVRIIRDQATGQARVSLDGRVGECRRRGGRSCLFSISCWHQVL